MLAVFWDRSVMQGEKMVDSGRKTSKGDCSTVWRVEKNLNQKALSLAELDPNAVKAQ